ncbi:MAG: S9 family peptidase [Flavobacteriales bacterium]|nr:S9 family peptidase [Flavobacteriales bacterium]
MKKVSILLLFQIISFIAFNQEITIEKIWKKYEFYAKSVEGFKSMKDGEHYTRPTTDLSIKKYSLLNDKDAGTTLVEGKDLLFKGKSIEFDDYEFNSDESKILLLTSTEPIYRRSFKAIYFLYDINSKKLQPLDEEHQPQTLAEYSPDGTMVSYIHGNDLFVKNIKTGAVKKLTQDGKRNKIINGTTDWVYEEEFSITKAYGWSPDSKTIAFLRFDEKEVPEFSMAMYGELYPDEYKYKYPKAGEVNSKVTAHLVDVASAKISNLDLGEYEYIPRLNWSTTAKHLILQTMNRHQSSLKYHLFDCTGKKPIHKVIFEEKSDTYIDVDDNLLILKDGKTILRTSEVDGYNHIYKLDFDGKATQITKGNWDVIEFLGIDDDNKTIYYSSAELSSIKKAVYAINIDGTNKRLISSNKGYNEAEFTQGMKYCVMNHSDGNTPPSYSLYKNDGTKLRDLETNEALNLKLKEYKLSTKEFMTFKSNDVELNGWMLKPANFDATKKYPVYMTVYGGPGHNEVTDAWDGNDYMYHQLLAQKGYIVVCVDPRGTMYRGAKFKKSTYLQLGKLEIEDVINTGKELQKLSYIDPARIGIMGWSFGGFMASLAITKGADVFKMAIAVAPVTNWRYYDNIYTERFMRTPKENEDGYDRNSPINFVDQIKGKYFLIHGSADDNVHYQNSMEMISALVKANKQFDLFIYPNKNHGIYGGNTRNHLFQMMLDYVLINL